MDTKAFVAYKEKITKECSKVIVGKDDVIEKVLICYLCGGHILLEDVPGTGKPCFSEPFQRLWAARSKEYSSLPIYFPPI